MPASAISTVPPASATACMKRGNFTRWSTDCAGAARLPTNPNALLPEPSGAATETRMPVMAGGRVIPEIQAEFAFVGARRAEHALAGHGFSRREVCGGAILHEADFVAGLEQANSERQSGLAAADDRDVTHDSPPQDCRVGEADLRMADGQKLSTGRGRYPPDADFQGMAAFLIWRKKGAGNPRASVGQCAGGPDRERSMIAMRATSAPPLATFNAVDTLDPGEAEDEVARIFCPHRLTPLRRSAPGFHAVHNTAPFDGFSVNYVAYGAAVEIDPGKLDRFFLLQVPLTGAADVRCGSARLRRRRRRHRCCRRPCRP